MEIADFRVVPLREAKGKSKVISLSKYAGINN
jgi:hypothetical protein